MQPGTPATLLITGATGTLGREVVQQALARLHHVRAYSRQPQPAVPPGVSVFQGDIRVGRRLPEALRGVDAVIHCASFYETGYATEVQGARQLIEAANAAGSPHLVYISIVGVDASPFPYYRAKLEVEHQLQQSSVPWSILRTTQFHEYVLRLMLGWENDITGVITLPAGARLQPVSVLEVAAALVTLAEQPAAGRVPDMAGPEVLTLEDMAATYLRIFHKRGVVRSENLPGEFYDALRSAARLAPERPVGRLTWESFLKQRALENVGGN